MCKIGTEHFIEWKTPLLLNNNPHQKLASLIKFEILHDKDVIAVGDFSLHELILKQGSDLDFVVKTMKGEFTVNFTNIIATTTSTTASTNTGFKFKAKRFFGKLTSGSNKDLSSSNSPAKELAHHTVFKQGSITIFNCVG